MDEMLKRCDVLMGTVALVATVVVCATRSDASSEEAGLEVYEVRGTIKWFDGSKGYGFIVPDSGLPDVLLHQRCLETCGFSAVSEGARVRAQVIRRPKGMQALRILEVDRSSERIGLPQRTPFCVTTTIDA